MRKIKNEDITRMILEIMDYGYNSNGLSIALEKESRKLGGDKGLSSERIRQLSKGGKLGAGSVLYERAIANLYKRICK